MKTQTYKPDERTVYDLLNEVETDLRQYDAEAAAELDIRRIKQQAARIAKVQASEHTKHRQRRLRPATGAACAMLLAVGLVAVSPTDSPVYAAKESVAYQISQFLGLDRDLQEYASMPGTSVTDSGYTIQLNEVILDRDTLLAATTVYRDGEELPMAIPSGDVYINGRDAASVATGSAGKDVKGALTEFRLKDSVNTSGQLDIKVVYHNISLPGDSPAGRWGFHFTADGSALAADTQVIPLDYRLTLENGAEIRLSRYTGNFIGHRIDYSMHGQVNRNIKLEGVDDQGRKIAFYSSVYAGNTAGTEGSGYLQCETIESAAITEETKWILLTPYLGQDYVDENGRHRTKYEAAGEPLLINLMEQE